MRKKISKDTFIFILIIAVIITPKFTFEAIPVLAQSADPIPNLITQVSITNLIDVSTTLVTQYGPRHEDFHSPYIDASCTLSSSTTYPKTNIEMSSDYVKGLFEAMGYPSNSITMELVPQGAGHNVYVTKVGNTYPNVYIEFSAHMDSVSSSPGGADNSSGSTAVIELARVLKDYPNRYSMRFILWVGEEFSNERNAAFFGSSYHVQQALARGEQIKAGLNMDHIGQPYPSDPTGYMNAISTNNAASERIANLFDQVRTEYGIVIGFADLGAVQSSDQNSYWDRGQTAVSSGGGSFYYKPNYHSCGDTVSNISFTNTLRVAQQNLAVGLKLDGESYGSTNTPTVTSTVTPGPSLTATLTATFTPTVPTSTLGAPTGFPSAGVLDNFNRADGVVGNAWSGRTTGYSISANQLRVGSSGEQDIYWTSPSFGTDQEVYVTLTTINQSGAEIGLALKSQSNNGASSGLIEVLYNPGPQQVQVWTYQGTQGWIQRGANIPVTFVNGDQFGVRAKPNGQVEVYKNGSLVGSRDVTAWAYYAQGGYIGLFMYNVSNTVLDDFGGGTVGASPTSTPTNTPLPPTATYTSTHTSTPTSTPALPTATFTSTSTPAPSVNTGFLLPSAHSPQTSNAGDNNGYETSPANAFVDDGVVATDLNSGTNTNTSCTNNGKDKHLFYDFNFNLPPSAIVQGIQVRLDARADSASNNPRICVQFSWNGGATWTTAKQTSTLSTTEVTYILGSTSDAWGRTWAVSNFSNANFRLSVIDVASSTARDFYLDYIAIDVTYQP